MSQSAMWTWNEETPGSVPAGARISAGKLGRVARSLPNSAEASVNRVPASCIPSPESPANRMTTRSSCSTSLDLINVSSDRAFLLRFGAAPHSPPDDVAGMTRSFYVRTVITQPSFARRRHATSSE